MGNVIIAVICFFIAILCVCGFIVSTIKRKDSRKTIEIEKNETILLESEQKNTEDHQIKTFEKQKQKQIYDQIVQMITSDFAKIGWSEWDGSVHQITGQLDRLERATDETNSINVVLYNPTSGYAKVKGNSNNYYLVSHRGCSCPDFRERRVPCKHMYRLAIFIAENEKPVFEDNGANMPVFCEDDLFYGFTFNITGMKQEPVKQLILKHFGMFKQFLTKDTTAIIMSDDKKTSRVYEGKSLGIEIFSVNELESLFAKKA